MSNLWGYLIGLVIGILIANYMDFKERAKFKVGDMVYLKPTGKKYMIFDASCETGKYYLANMDGILINRFPYHQNLFDKSPPIVQ